MNKLIKMIILVGLFSLSSAFAAQKDHSSMKETHYSDESSSSMKWGLGLSTPHPCSVGTPSVTGMIDIGAGNVIQMWLGIGSTSPFTMGAGGAFKHDLIGHESLGLHVGGGVGLGAASGGASGGSVFAADIAGLAGIHAEIPGLSQLQFQFDAGPQFLVTSGGTFQFALGSVSAAFGLSVLYIF